MVSPYFVLRDLLANVFAAFQYLRDNDKKTAIVGGVVGVGILLTGFCCEGKVEEAPAIEATPAVEEVKEAVKEVKEAVEEVLPAESVE